MARRRHRLSRRVATLALLVSSHGAQACRAAELNASPSANEATPSATTTTTTSTGEKSDVPGCAVVEEKTLSPGPRSSHDSYSNSTSRETTHGNSGECSAGASTRPTPVEEEKGEGNEPEIDDGLETRISRSDAQNNNAHRHAAKTRKISSHNTTSSTSQKKKGGAAECPADHDSEIVSTSSPVPERHGLPAALMTGMDHEALSELNQDPWALYEIVAGVDAVTSWEVLRKVCTAVQDIGDRKAGADRISRLRYLVGCFPHYSKFSITTPEVLIDL